MKKTIQIFVSIILIGQNGFSQLTANISSWTDNSCNSICDGEITIFASSGTPPYYYLWNDLNAQTTATAIGLCTMNYKVTVTDAVNDSVVLDYTLQTFTSSQIDSVLIVPASDFSSCNGSIELFISGPQSIFSYYWSNDSTTNPLTNICNGSYSVLMLDAGNCLFSWYGILPVVTIIENNNKEVINRNEILIYPNPANEQIFIELLNFKNSLLEIFNLEGQLIKGTNIQTTKTKLDIENIVAGFYIIKVTNSNGISLQKFIKY